MERNVSFVDDDTISSIFAWALNQFGVELVGQASKQATQLDQEQQHTKNMCMEKLEQQCSHKEVFINIYRIWASTLIAYALLFEQRVS